MDKVKEIYNELYRAMIAKDTEVLELLLNDNFELIHMTGMRQSKMEFIKAIKSGVLNYYSCEGTDFTSQDFGSKANIIGKSRVNASVFGGGRRTWPLQLHIELVKNGKEWEIIKIKASIY